MREKNRFASVHHLRYHANPPLIVGTTQTQLLFVSLIKWTCTFQGRQFMKSVWLTSTLWLITAASALAANPEWDQATRLYNSGDYRAALSAFRKISDKNPSEPTAHYMLAQCYKNNGNTKQAIAELEWITNSTSDRRVKGPAESLLAQLKSGGGGGGVRPASGTQSSSSLILSRGAPPPSFSQYARVENAISPYSIPPGGFQSGANIVGGAHTYRTANEAIAAVKAMEANRGANSSANSTVNTSASSTISTTGVSPATASSSARSAASAAEESPPPKELVGGTVDGAVSAAAKKGWMPCRFGCLSFDKSGWVHHEGEGFEATSMYMPYPNPSDPALTQYFSQRHIGMMIKDAKEAGSCPHCKGSGWVRTR